MATKRRQETTSQIWRSIKVSDGNGGGTTQWVLSIDRMRAVAGLIVSILTILTVVVGGIFAGVKFGITTNAREVIEVECGPEGMITHEIETSRTEMIDEVEGIVQGNMDYLESKVTAIQQTQNELVTGQKELATQQRNNTDELKLLLHKAINGG